MLKTENQRRSKLSELLVRPASPGVFLRKGRARGTQTLVVCAGDSITHGLISANYVQMLRARLAPQGYEFVNAGITGDLIWNLAERLDQVIACQPDVVTVLIGTNDTAARINDDWLNGYMKTQGLPRRPDLEWYHEQLSKIVVRLLTETNSRTALMTIPPLGEDPGSPYNTLVTQTNRVIRKVGETYGVTVLPLHDRLVAALPQQGSAPRFDEAKRLMGSAALRRLLLRQPYDSISRRHARTLLTDDVHLNESAAGIARDVVQEFLRTVADLSE